MPYDFREYVDSYQRYASLGALETIATLREGEREYPLLRLMVPGERTVVVTAGFHGEEPAPPLTLLEHTGDVVDYARSRGLGLRIYPCINPSGFEDGTRYNRSGEKPNNDFLRYELHDGTVVDEGFPGMEFRAWRLAHGGPKETRAMRDELDRWPAPAAALDLHQDRYLEGAFAYAYVFGEADPYVPLVEETARHAALAKGYKADERHHTDELGLVRHHDGSVTDYFFRRGVKHTACLETTTETPLDACHRVNLAWIKGFIDLVAEG